MAYIKQFVILSRKLQGKDLKMDGVAALSAVMGLKETDKDALEKPQQDGRVKRLAADEKTPQKIRKMQACIVNSVDPTCPTTPRTKRQITAGMQELRDLQTPPRRVYSARAVAGLLAAGGVEASPDGKGGVTPLTPGREASLAHILRRSDLFYQQLLSDIAQIHGRKNSPIGNQVINWEHIEDPEGHGGFHFCPVTHALRHTLTNVYTDPKTGIFCGTFTNPWGKVKTSTFFPDCFPGIPELKSALNEAEIVEEGPGIRLLKVDYSGISFHAQCYVRGILVLSVFPIFFFGDLTKSPKGDVEILGTSYKVGDLLKKVQGNPVLSSPKGDIYDIAWTLKHHPDVKKGIYIRVSNSV